MLRHHVLLGSIYVRTDAPHRGTGPISAGFSFTARKLRQEWRSLRPHRSSIVKMSLLTLYPVRVRSMYAARIVIGQEPRVSDGFAPCCLQLCQIIHVVLYFMVRRPVFLDRQPIERISHLAP